jgi:hypothetical protein
LGRCAKTNSMDVYRVRFRAEGACLAGLALQVLGVMRLVWEGKGGEMSAQRSEPATSYTQDRHPRLGDDRREQGGREYRLTEELGATPALQVREREKAG